MSVETLIASKDGPPVGLLDTHVESFLRHLRAAGYAERTLSKKRSIVASFLRWTRFKQVLLEDLNESHLAAFVKRSPRRRKGRATFELAALRLFLKYLRFEAGVSTPAAQIDSSPIGRLHRRYVHYLRNERGLAENSIHVYAPYVHDFLTEVVVSSGSAPPSGLDAGVVRDFLLAHVRDRSSQYSRLLAAALRSFLRFLYLRGETVIDLPCPSPRSRDGARPQYPPSSPPRSWNVSSAPRIGRHRAADATTRSCFSSPDLAFGRERSSASSSMTSTGGRPRLSFAVRAVCWTACPCSPMLERRWRFTSARTGAAVPLDRSF